jgi:hypothetical protein
MWGAGIAHRYLTPTCVSAYVSFNCKPSLLSLFIWKHSHVFINWPFLSKCRTSIMLVMGPYACCVSSMCCEYFDLGLFDHMDWIWSLYLVLKFLPVCPMYFFGHHSHFSLYIPLLLYMLVFYLLYWRWFCMVFFCFICYFYVCVFKKPSSSGFFSYICECCPFFLLWYISCRVFILLSSNVYTCMLWVIVIL